MSLTKAGEKSCVFGSLCPLHHQEGGVTPIAIWLPWYACLYVVKQFEYLNVVQVPCKKGFYSIWWASQILFIFLFDGIFSSTFNRTRNFLIIQNLNQQTKLQSLVIYTIFTNINTIIISMYNKNILYYLMNLTFFETYVSKTKILRLKKSHSL